MTDRNAAKVNLTGVTVTADALHTQRAHAHFLVEQKDAHYAFTVKKNQPILYTQLKTLPWDKATAKFYDRSHGHGRLETRVVQLLTGRGLTSHQASPERLAKIVRSQWTIENRLHFVRDTTFAEDAWKVRTGHGPENMATLRNFAINRLCAEGHANIAAGLREMSYEPFRARWTSPDQQQSKITRLGSSPGWLPPLRAWQ